MKSRIIFNFSPQLDLLHNVQSVYVLSIFHPENNKKKARLLVVVVEIESKVSKAL